MNVFRFVINVATVSIAALAASTNIGAQEIPYGISDKGKLGIILRDAKAHLLSQENDLNWLKAAGIASHQLAIMKVEGASDEAVGYLKKASELAPDNAEILAYLGSAYAMAGRDSGFVVSKVSNVNKGLAALDKAVKKAPSNLDVRFIRGSVSYGLPVMFSRKATAESDYLFFVNEAKKGAPVNTGRIAEAYFKLGQIATGKNQVNEARDFYMQAEKASPQSDWAQQANKAMK